jgi:FSR family fosmidomycin resistance protein-like MFS transporter
MSIAHRVLPSVAAPFRRPYLTGGGLVAFVALAHAATDAITSTVGALLPSIQLRLALTESSVALLVAALAVGASLAQPFLGALADRVGRQLLTGLGAILAAVAISLVGVVSSAPVLLLLLLVGGLGSAALHPAGASVARSALAGRAGLAVSLFGAGGTIGVALGPLIALAMVAWAGPTATPWLMIPGLLLGSTAPLLIPPTERRTSASSQPKLFDGALFVGPVGLLALTEVASSLAYLTFASTMPLWLVGVHGVLSDAALIGWTLATFSLSAALGGIVAGLLAARVRRRLIVSGTTLLAPLPLFALFQLEPGSPAYFVAAGLGGALVNAGLPLKIVTAQELVPRAVASDSGMLMGFAMGVAGLIYVIVGALQETVGLVPAASLVYGTLAPTAVLAFVVLGRHGLTGSPDAERSTPIALAGLQCSCARWYTERAPGPNDSATVDPAPSGRGPRQAGVASSIDGPSICACGLTDGDCTEGRSRCSRAAAAA